MSSQFVIGVQPCLLIPHSSLASVDDSVLHISLMLLDDDCTIYLHIFELLLVYEPGRYSMYPRFNLNLAPCSFAIGSLLCNTLESDLVLLC